MAAAAGAGLEIGPAQYDQQSGKDKFSFTELVLLDECLYLTIIRKDK